MQKRFGNSPAVRISMISILINLLLSAVKLAAGLFGHSQALVADAVHSASDVLTTVIVIAALFVSAKAPDRNHEYGHQRYESLASLFLAILLSYVGISIGISSVTAVVSGSYMTAQIPSILTAAAALLSIIVKEVMYHATMKVAVKEKSNALKADAWHHRSDALSSIGSLAGVLFARFGMTIMDPIAGAVICILILKTAVGIAIDATKALTDSACDAKIESQLNSVVAETEGVHHVDLLKTRIFGSGFYADIEISVDGTCSLNDAHRIAQNVHDRVEARFPDLWHCMVHVNPDSGLEKAA